MVRIKTYLVERLTMKSKIHYIYPKAKKKISKTNKNLVHILGEAYVISLLNDFKAFAKEIDETQLDGTFS